ncbi:MULTISPECIES: hypothetical protein [unclassified Nocardioides]|nr:MULTISPECIES: hypothetical protein [unclassified Nocardioides]
MSMSVSGTPHATPRVRDRARDVVALMAFSAGVSVTLTVALLLLMSLGR